MNAICLRFYVSEGARREGVALHDWLFEQARACGIGGGSAMRACAGFGRHGLHEDSFFELAGDLPMIVEFLGSEESIERLVTCVRSAGLGIVHATHRVTMGVA